MLLDQTSQNEWVVNSGCTHHMAKDDSLFSSLDTTIEKKIYVVDGFSLGIVGHGDFACEHGRIIKVYHVPSLSMNMLFVSQLEQARKIIELWHDGFLIEYLKKDRSIVAKRVLNSKDRLYKVCDLSQPNTRPMALISQVHQCNKIWHERLEHLNFNNLKLMVTLKMFSSLPKVLPPNGFCKGFVLGNNQ